MQLYRTIKPGLFPNGAAVAVGNFEGLHLGHQAIIGKLVNLSKAMGVPAVVVTFEPSPKQFFIGKAPMLRLSTLAEKLKGLSALGVDAVICLRFNQSFSKMSCEDFVSKCLSEQLQARHVIVGDDFRFGANRAGDVAFLKGAGKDLNFLVTSLPQIALDGERVSSTWIREKLQCGDVVKISRALGRAYRLDGYVIKGAQRGRLIGFPTANINPPKIFLPQNGVYFVRAQLDKTYYGLTNLGVRPTVDGTKLALETHLLNFSQDIYGQKISIEFLKRIRNEQRFESLDELRKQIHDDVQHAKSYLEP
jgi:riboflavin kinase / FMN adenylyltransferase